MEFWADLYAFFGSRGDEVWERLVEHVTLSSMALVAICLIGIPLGILISRLRHLSPWVIGTVSVLYTIPSLALFGLMIPFFGIGFRPALIALIVYGLLPLVRNTYVGVVEVNAAVLEAADGMGSTSRQRLFLVELPMAFPVIVAGIRTVAVMTIGMTTIAAFIGAGGLGSLIMRGISSINNVMIVAGTVPAAALAVIVDLGLGALENQLRVRILGEPSKPLAG